MVPGSFETGLVITTEQITAILSKYPILIWKGCIMKHENLFKIYIPEPCHEEWDKMTPNQQGAYCKVCAKTVVDFSDRKEEEIQRFLNENVNNKICGRFRVNQLSQNEVPPLKISINKPKFEFPGFLLPVLTPFRATALALMLCASVMLSSCAGDGSGGGDDDRLAGAVELVDTTDNSYNIDDSRIQGGITVKKAADSTCNIEDDPRITRTFGKIKIERTPPPDTLKTDSTEIFMKGEVLKKTHGVIKKVQVEK
jgi:hypothetical protein